MSEIHTKEKEITAVVYEFFSRECGVDPSTLTPATNIVEELEGDSLMLLSLLEVVRKKYQLKIDLKTLGKHLMKRPANTLGQVIELTLHIVEHGDNIVNISL